MKNLYTLLTILVIAMLAFPVSDAEAQEDDPSQNEEMYSMSLTDLMEVEVEVASKSKQSMRESPGIISVISREQIQKMGARDLIDVLRMIPGFQFGVDVQGVVGVGIRGNWAHEGKMSLQVDGQEINETLYSTTQFGRHFPVDHIQRIEIIRGPGSALYGGYAELGVVNIITRDAAELDGAAFSTSFSEMEGNYGQRNMSLSYGTTTNDLEISLHTFLGAANRSDRNYTGLNSSYDGFTTYNMANEAPLNNVHANMAVNKGNWETRLIVDRYHTRVRDGFDAVTSSFHLTHNSLMLNSSYTFDVSDKFSLTPTFSYKQQSPWRNVNENAKAPYYYLNTKMQRATSRITASFNATENLHLLGGVEIYSDHAMALDTFDYFIPVNSNNSMQAEVRYMNYSAFIQGELETSVVNVLAGARFEENSAFGSSFVPRLALTKAFDKLHFKLLASQAFRAPGIANINANRVVRASGIQGVKKIQPEETLVLELEAGYQLGSSLFFAANVFDVTIDNPIVYFFEQGMDGYQNYDKTGTRGLELDMRYNPEWGNLNLTYSHYMQADKNKVAAYTVPEQFDKEALLGMARDKLTLFASFALGDNLSVSPSVVYTGEKYGWAPETNDAGEVVWDVNTVFDPTTQVHLSLSYNNLFTENLALSVSGYNLLNEEINYVQPYLGWHAPLPGASREIMAKVSYNLFR